MAATIIVPGRLTKDAEKRQAGASEVVSFSVATNCFERKEKVTRFYDCSFFGRRAVSMFEKGLLTKGSAVTVTGTHSTREHNGKTYNQVDDVSHVELQGGGQRNESGGGHAPAPVHGGGDGGFGGESPATTDDDFPF